MTATYLIDGFNLIHALGFLSPGGAPHALERARMRLLQFLLESGAATARPTTVVFDAAHAPARARSVLSFKGIDVRFAVGEDEADDLIEALIHEHPAPRNRLTVVSSDHRLLHAARREGAVGWNCTEFLDHLDASHRQRAPEAPPRPEKTDRLSADEAKHWLHEFGDLADDPGFKELFDPYPFEDMD